MEPFNTNQNPVASGSQMPPISPEERTQGGPSAPKSGGVGPIAGAIIVIILLIAGGLYFWGAKLNQQSADIPAFIPSNDSSMQDTSPPTTELDSDTSAGLPPQSSSDDVTSIQSDFNAMDVDQMNSQNSAEMSNI
ncbi:hypothetical protein A2765_02115 [Candidatus Kaiserbacteria bacterium RIFCSPHIGHO2_01_FULL_56_24]|uniref:Uncharacterized protein n=1 Tax=Candidatus Kaiserbacteria bacterium RIFCSPHIGHO2_01_FULL_56_24 TaxID=1798487 RepID=A0A1F6DAS5_9BACT|nr:MAG: hypothetical protein A2765_02115 [Candidatus Kaiserbacteria bacterium RIFCSPHIGHO2_01_FULL_56_24]